MMGKYYKKILKLDERKNNSFLSNELLKMEMLSNY